MKRKLLPMVLLCLSSVVAQADTVIVNENFESYADNAALRAQWVPNQSPNNGYLWSTNMFANPDAFPSGGNGVDHIGGNVMVWNTPLSLQPSATQNVVLEADIYDNATSANKRMSIGLRQNVGIANLFEMGAWQAAPAPYYSFRMVGFPGAQLPPEADGGWVKLTNMVDDQGSPITNNGPVLGWHRFRVVFAETGATITLDLNRDGNINGTAVIPLGYAAGGFENLRIGSPSGVTSAGGGLVFDNVKLTLIDVMAGNNADFNGNGVVDAADYTVWRNNLGLVGTGTRATGDANGDTNVDQTDYALWKSSFGTMPGSGAIGGVAVPEPASLLLLMVGAAAATRRRAR